MERLADKLFCCCVTPNADASMNGAELLGSAPLSQGFERPSTPIHSNMPRFRPPSQMNKRDSGSLTDRSTISTGSSGMSPEEKEREKARLRRLVKDFAKEAVTGMAVCLLCPESVRKLPHFFQMDRHLTVFTLKPKDGSSADAAVQDFNVSDLVGIFKGADVCLKAPSLGTAGGSCVGMETNRADRRLFFHFDNHFERDKFYTCLKILLMSAQISAST